MHLAQLNTVKRLCLKLGFLFVLSSSALVVVAQEKSKTNDEPVSYQAIRMKLVFRSKTHESDAGISGRIAKDVKRLTVDFMIVTEQEGALKEIGATNELISAIRSAFPEAKRKYITLIDEMSELYIRFTDNYARKTASEMKIAIEAGKEFLRRFGEYPEVKEQVDFITSQLSRLEKKQEDQSKPCLFGTRRPPPPH